MKLSGNIEFSFSDCEFNEELLRKMCLPKEPDIKIVTIPTIIQKRKHKKKRINKKWKNDMVCM